MRTGSLGPDIHWLHWKNRKIVPPEVMSAD